MGNWRHMWEDTNPDSELADDYGLGVRDSLQVPSPVHLMTINCLPVGHTPVSIPEYIIQQCCLMAPLLSRRPVSGSELKGRRPRRGTGHAWYEQMPILWDGGCAGCCGGCDLHPWHVTLRWHRCGAAKCTLAHSAAIR